MAAVAARANGKKGSWVNSADHSPSNPASRDHRATVSASAKSPDKNVSTFSVDPFRSGRGAADRTRRGRPEHELPPDLTEPGGRRPPAARQLGEFNPAYDR
jgi:hypothetical protein